MKNFNLNTTNNDTWLTPPDLVSALGEFDLDPCCPKTMPWKTAKKMLSLENGEDGLTYSWGDGRVWLNPPYGKETAMWVDKLSNHTGGGLALIFARTDTKWFHSAVFEKAHSIFFFKGRISFHYEDGTKASAANAPSCLVSFTEHDTEMIDKALKDNKLKGKLLKLT